MVTFIRTRPRLVAGMTALLLSALAVWGAYTFAHLADTMVWDCGGGSCATNDARTVTMPVALLGTIGACLLGGYAVGLIGPAIAIAASALAFRAGLHAAVADGYSHAASLGGAITTTTIALVVAALCAAAWVPLFISNRRLAARVRARAQEHPPFPQ